MAQNRKATFFLKTLAVLLLAGSALAGTISVSRSFGFAFENCAANAYDCATQYIVILPDRDAPPSERSMTPDLSNYEITFEDDFNSLQIAPDGAAGKWYAPHHAPIGAAKFDPPGPDGPFFVKKGHLIIQARNENGEWHSGLIQTVDSKWQGFAQQYGYFEIRAKFSSHPLSFPAFWLVNKSLQTVPGAPASEIDVIEGNGAHPGIAYLHAHMTPCFFCKTGVHRWVVAKAYAMADTSKDFHTYGVLIDKTWVTYYVDRVEVLRIPTLEEFKTPFYILVDLAAYNRTTILPQDDTIDMDVDYVRVYQRKPGSP